VSRTKLSPGRESKTLLSDGGYVLPVNMTPAIMIQKEKDQSNLPALIPFKHQTTYKHEPDKTISRTRIKNAFERREICFAGECVAISD
jgi:hypothetical protein